MIPPESPALVRLHERAARIADTVARDEHATADARGEWPTKTMDALAREGLLGLLVPQSAGGPGGGFLELVTVCEQLGRVWPSAGLTFGMHCVGTACIAARATPEQRERYLAPILAGEHVTTLALSEPGSGARIYLPHLAIRQEEDGFVLDGQKAFVTNAAHAQSFVVSTGSLTGDDDSGRFNLLVVDTDLEGVDVGGAWTGLGMRGNDARTVNFQGTRVPQSALLGEIGGETWYMFEVVAPYFLAAMAGTYLGVATGAVEGARDAVAARSYDAIGVDLADDPLVQDQFARMWTRVAAARALLHDAARAADAELPTAGRLLMAAKATLDEVSIGVTTDALALAGGRAYRDNAQLAALHRDALASQVMSPTAPLLRSWIARDVLGRPLLGEDPA